MTAPEQAQDSAKSREQIQNETHSILVEAKNTVEKSMLKTVETILNQIPSLPQPVVKTILDSLKNAQEAARLHPKAMDRAIAEIQQMILSGKNIATDVQSLAQSPRMLKFQNFIGTFSTVFGEVQKSMSVLGSGVLKMLEGVLGAGFLGKLCTILKNSDLAQKVYLMKTLQEKKKDLAEDTSNEDILIVLQGFLTNAWDAEPPTKKPLYDIVQLLETIMADPAIRDKKLLSKEDFIDAGKRAVDKYIQKLPTITATPVAPTDTPVPELLIDSNPKEVLGMKFAFTPDTHKATVRNGTQTYEIKITKDSAATRISEVKVAAMPKSSDPTTFEFTINIGEGSPQKLSIPGKKISEAMNKTVGEKTFQINEFKIEFTPPTA